MWWNNRYKFELIPIGNMFGIEVGYNNERLKFIIDTGATANFINKRFIEAHPDMPVRWELGGISTLRGRSTKMQVTDLSITLKGSAWYSDIFVVEDIDKRLSSDMLCDGLLGLPFLERCSIEFLKRRLIYTLERDAISQEQ